VTSEVFARLLRAKLSWNSIARKGDTMPMRILLLLTVALIAAGCGGDDDQDAVQDAATAVTDTAGAAETLEDALEGAEIALDLDEQNGSGITGTATLSPTSEGQVEVEIELDGSEGGPHPAHIHKGSCADLDPNPAFPLEDVVDGRSKTTVDVDVADVTADEYAINVHESPENAENYVACGDVRNQ
jgi:FtsP/CotA-like multicopper oxidase with cupredoxin domain